MQEDKIEKVMEQFDLSFLQNVSWMSEHKKNELQERILHLREIKQEKEQLKQERSKIQMNIERMTDAYEMEVKKVKVVNNDDEDSHVGYIIYDCKANREINKNEFITQIAKLEKVKQINEM